MIWIRSFVGADCSALAAEIAQLSEEISKNQVSNTEDCENEISMVEWRADCFLEEISSQELAEIFSPVKMPIILTIRTKIEGGQFVGSAAIYQKLLKKYLASGIFSSVDLEINRVDAPQLIEIIRKFPVKLITSFHQVDYTPSLVILKEIRQRMRALPVLPDVEKFAVTIQQPEDLVTLKIFATENSQEKNPPQIIIGMGNGGWVSRIYPETFASSATFVAGNTAAAPGQLTLATIQKIRQSTVVPKTKSQ
ncbi:type I 3-dehydroquinate dehydratase [Enterococcus timonensis]|uniref:type I 3-dehydroquinate dehydratase n=1 Tax=Enterococcus timonensis TaxID=1852364 RepID=UPI0008D9F30B|nr:type I 3-dehydroquinate dehydratase [Enterococcus timonensis]